MLLKDRHTEPPNGWRFVEPATGREINGDFLSELVQRVIEHRQWMNQTRSAEAQLVVDPDLVHLEVQRQICRGLEDECVAEPGENVVRLNDKFRELNAEKILSFSAAIFAFLAGFGSLCSPEESARRATICRGCKFNRLSGTCSCSLVWKLMENLVPKSRREGGLKVCGICGCTLMAKVVVPRGTVDASNEGRGFVFPEWCWQK